MKMKICRTSIPIVGIVLVFCAYTLASGADTYPEHEVKAAFLYNFIKFADWPEEKVKDANQPMIIFVVGSYPECKTFKDIQSKGSVQVRMFKSFDQISDPNILKDCHVLFVSSSEKKDITRILNVVKDYPVLTVGEDDSFLDAGGIINFVEYEEKIRFEINLPAATRADIKLRSKLLKLARRVVTEEGEG
ncbi:MAG: YfiR family protein [Phycisphaerae bacterium]|jgi:hypothetical protein